MAISKLILNGVTQMDVTDTTATVSDVASGKVFTQVDGVKGTGAASGSDWTRKDGKTYLHINIIDDKLKTIYFRFNQTVNNGNTINWGDGTSQAASLGTGVKTYEHTYSNLGEYVITITNTSGTFKFGEGSTIGAFIFIPPDGARSWDNWSIYCHILEKVELGTGWDCSEGRQFLECHRLTNVYINNRPSQTLFGDTMFCGCYSLREISGADEWDSGITSFGTSGGLFKRTPMYKLYVPPNATTIPKDYNRENCALDTVDIPEGIVAINESAFASSKYIREIIIPSTVTSIGSKVFENCYSYEDVWLRPTTPPSLDNVNSFPKAGTSRPRVFHVPHGCLEAYQTATNWSNFASEMQEESQ